MDINMDATAIEQMGSGTQSDDDDMMSLGGRGVEGDDTAAWDGGEGHDFGDEGTTTAPR